jgi:hypothetical protein
MDALRAIVRLTLAVALAGCLAAPMPSPGRPDRERILVSVSDAVRQGGPVGIIGVVGLDGAAPGAGLVEIRQPFGGSVTIARSSVSGSFAAVLAAAAGDRLVIVFRESEDGAASDEVELLVFAPAADGVAAPETDPASLDRTHVGGSMVASAADAEGRTRLTGEDLVAGHVAAVGNARTGEVVEAPVPASGALEVTLAARTGDTIVVIVRSPSDGRTSQLASLSVPAP